MSTQLDARRTPRDPEKTRERILDAAQALILDHGYGATTVDAVVGRAGITKGAFFHHFASKAELARTLIQRFAAWDRKYLEDHVAHAEKLASDPLPQLLTLIALYEEDFTKLEEPFPGCLFAAYIYENKLFDDGVLEILRESTLFWRATMRRKLDQVVALHPPRKPVDLDAVADLFYALTEGSFIMAKTLGDNGLLARHARELRTLLEVLFEPR